MKKNISSIFLLLVFLIFMKSHNCSAQGGLSKIFNVVSKNTVRSNSIRTTYKFKNRLPSYKPKVSTPYSARSSRMTYGRNYRSYQGLKRKYTLNNATQLTLNHKTLGTIKRNQARRALELRKQRQRALSNQRTVKLKNDQKSAAEKAIAAKNNQARKAVANRKQIGLDKLKKNKQQLLKAEEKKLIDKRNRDRKKKTLEKIREEKKTLANKNAEKKKLLNKKLKPLGKGSTGRVKPNSLNEKLIMDEVKSNPYLGTDTRIKLNDSRWPSEKGWKKMHYSKNVIGKNEKVVIHYNAKFIRENIVAIDDFKFIDLKE